MCVAVSDTIMRKKQAKIFFLYLAVFFVAYGGFVFQVHFSNDDYDFLFHQKEIAVTVASESYRNAMGVFYWVLDVFAINVVQNQVFFGILLIVSFAWSAAVLTMEMYRAAGQDSKIFLLGTGSLFMYLNAFACEWMWYAGAYIQWMVAMLTATYAAVFVAGSEKSRKKFLIGAGLLFLTASSYQICLAHYICIVMTLLFFRFQGKVTGRFLCMLVRAAVICAFSIGGNMALTKILVSADILYPKTRLNMGNFMSVARFIIESQKDIWLNGYGLFPDWVIPFALVVILACTFWIMRGYGCFAYLYMLLTILMGQSLIYAACIMQGIERLPMRMLEPLFDVFSVCLFYLAFYAVYQKERMVCRLAGVSGMAFLLFHILSLQYSAADTVRTNTLDRYYILQIADRIRTYEQEHHIEVTAIGVCYDASLEYKYGDYIKNGYYGEILSKAFMNEWSDVSAINYYSGRSFDRTEVPQEVKEQVRQLNWDYVNLQEQMIFCGNEVYIAVY